MSTHFFTYSRLLYHYEWCARKNNKRWKCSFFGIFFLANLRIIGFMAHSLPSYLYLLPDKSYRYIFGRWSVTRMQSCCKLSQRDSSTKVSNSSIYHCNENSIYVFPEKELRSLPHSQFPHLCVCEGFIYSQDQSTYFPAAEKADRSR